MEEDLTDIEIVERYLAERDCFPDYALNNTRVIALAGFSTEALELFHESLSKQTPTNRSIDLIFYSDPEKQHYYYPEAAELLISFAKYTHPTKVIFADGFFKQKGATIVLKYIVEHIEYFQNLQHLEISGHLLALPPEEEEEMSRRLTGTEGAPVDKEYMFELLEKCCNLKRDLKEMEMLEKIDLSNNKWEVFGEREKRLRKLKENVVMQSIDWILEPMREPRASICYDNNGAHYTYYNVEDPEESEQCGHLWSHDIGETSVYVDACVEINDLPLGITEVNIKADICAEFEEVAIPPTVETVVLDNPGSTRFTAPNTLSVFIGCSRCPSMPYLSFPEVKQVFIGDNSFPTVGEASLSFPKALKLVVGKATLSACKTFTLKRMHCLCS